MDWKGISIILGVVLNFSGIIGIIKAISIARNANKNTDIRALQQAINTIQNTYRETIQDLEKRIDFLENETVKQYEQNKQHQDSIEQLERDLLIAQNKIETLEKELYKKGVEIQKRDIEIMRLEQQNIELRRANGERVGL